MYIVKEKIILSILVKDSKADFIQGDYSHAIL